MVNIVLLAASCTLDPCHQTAEKAYEMDNKPIVFRGIETEWAGSRERTSILRLRRSFFLDFPFYRTSLFIELIDRGRDLGASREPSQVRQPCRSLTLIVGV